MTKLDECHAETLKNHWKHYRINDGLLDYFRETIKHFDHSAITKTDDGRLVAYISMQYNGSMANLFVDPDFHSHNLGVTLLRDLTRKLLTKHQTAYGFIKTKDSAFISSCQSIGFSWVPQGTVSWIRYSPIPSPSTPQPPVYSTLSSIEQITNMPANNTDKSDKHLFLNALPLSCNECSGIPKDKAADKCIHVGL